MTTKKTIVNTVLSSAAKPNLPLRGNGVTGSIYGIELNRIARFALTISVICVVNPSPLVGNTYTLNEPPRFHSNFDYGFFGTITTNGSLGVQTTTDFIESWSITVMTPSGVDGVSTEVLTPINSSVSLDLASYPGLSVRHDLITMPPRRDSPPYLQLVWLTADGETELRFTSRFTGNSGLGIGATITDSSELDSGLGVLSVDIPFASRIPEPTTSTLVLAAFCLATVRRRG